MASSSKKRARIISAIASRIYFFVIILQVPLFRFPCRIGMCTTPIEVALSQLIASEVFPDVAVKAFLYPGVVAKAVIGNTAIPSYEDLLNFCKFSYMKEAPAATDLKHLEVIGGSYLCIVGGFLGLIKPGRASLFGMLLVIWGIAREIILGKHVATKDPSKAVSIYSTVWIPVVCAFFSVRGDVRKLIRSCKAKHIAKKLQTYSKAKCK
ncbi:hypothetical protein Fot_08622 [Forsythia ovata]|uniref:Uncharacterized protein n=1 Tax=Forsythia ovata TaxID=205694 RepID=A0ABD1X256_9LAMI